MARGAHVNTPPVAPSWHNEAVPRALENLVLRLLEKDPNARPASAAEVAGETEPPNLATETNTGRGVYPTRDPQSPVRRREGSDTIAVVCVLLGWGDSVDHEAPGVDMEGGLPRMVSP